METGEEVKIVVGPDGGRSVFRLNFPWYKRIWRLLSLVVRGWCYFD